MHSRQQFNISRAPTTQCTTSLEKLFTDSLMRMKDFSGQFEHFIHSKMFELSKYNTNAHEILQDFNAYTTMEAQTFKETIIQNMDSIEQCISERASHEQELKMTLKKLSERQLQIQQCKVQEVQSSVTSSGDETSSGIVSDEEIEKKELEAHYGFMAKIQEVLPAESSSTDTPLEQVQNNDEKNVFANERQHSEKHAAECADERAALANLIANLTLDTEENKTILKQLKKANASLTQELEKCKTNLDETNSALGEAISCRDSCLIALQIRHRSDMKNLLNKIHKLKNHNGGPHTTKLDPYHLQLLKLVADSVAAALEAQAATMENANNTNRKTRQRETSVSRKCSYKEFMSFHPFNFKGNDLKTYLRRFQELAVLCPTMVPNSEKLMEVFIGDYPEVLKEMLPLQSLKLWRKPLP
ncbi:hypothetical protein Tco_0606022 [Tanacetum coccineum]